MNFDKYRFTYAGQVIDITNHIDSLIKEYGSIDITIDNSINIFIHFMHIESYNSNSYIHSVTSSSYSEELYEGIKLLIDKRKRLFTLNMLDI